MYRNIFCTVFPHSLCTCDLCRCGCTSGFFCHPPPSFQPPQNFIQTAAKITSAVDILAQKAIHLSVHRPLKVVVKSFLISTDLLYPGEKMSHSCVHYVPTYVHVVLCCVVGASNKADYYSEISHLWDGPFSEGTLIQTDNQ